ncbi:MAG: hypothetical protein RH917_11525 [Lacipirellulaceae bacterium]
MIHVIPTERQRPRNPARTLVRWHREQERKPDSSVGEPPFGMTDFERLDSS